MHRFIQSNFDQQIQDILRTVEEAEQLEEAPSDSGLLNLAGFGKEGISQFNEVRLPPPMPDYDEEVTSERFWLAQPGILNNSRVEFEALLKAIAEESEE